MSNNVYVNYLNPPRKYRSKMKTEFIFSSKPEGATKKLQSFIDNLKERDIYVDPKNITPLCCFSGPSMQIGALVIYYEEEDNNEPIKTEE